MCLDGGCRRAFFVYCRLLVLFDVVLRCVLFVGVVDVRCYSLCPVCVVSVVGC